MAAAAPEAKSGKVVIKNIGLLLSGDLDNPILEADTIVVIGANPTDAHPVNTKIAMWKVLIA